MEDVKNYMKETGSLISGKKIDYTAQKRLREIFAAADNIPRYDKKSGWENIIKKYGESDAPLRAPAVRPLYKARTVMAVIMVLFTLNLITVIFAKTNLVTYLYDFHSGVLTVREADYNIEEKSTEYSKYFSSVYDGIKYFGRDIRLPHGLPKEYSLHKVYCPADKERIVISYISNDYEIDGKEISYCVSKGFDDYIEINEGEEPKTAEYNGTVYYMMHNIDRAVIQWVDNGMNCYITSTMPQEELFEIVKNMK